MPWVAAVYVVANLAASAQVAWTERDWRYLVQMPVAFVSLHLPYGAGSLWGVLRLTAMVLGRKVQ
jgi:succinoglycan biosynthesis protein ExoA